MAINEKDDKEFNDYLKGDSELSNHYRASNTEEPSEGLDEKILLAAKEAVAEPKQKSGVVFHKSPWALPVSIAAVITLSVSLVVTMQQETGQPLISEPEAKRYDSSVLLEERAISQSILVDDAVPLMNEVKVEQSSDEHIEDAAPAAGTLRSTDTYFAKESLKNNIPKKIISKEKVQAEVLEKTYSREERVLESAPAQVEAPFDDVIASKLDRRLNQQESELLMIKALLEKGNLSDAKQEYKNFIEKYPDFPSGNIKETLGTELYKSLNL